MLRRFVGTLVLLAATLLLVTCELAPGDAPVPTSGAPAAPPPVMALSSPLPVQSLPSVTPSPLPTRAPTATLVPSFTPRPTLTPSLTPTPRPTQLAIPSADVKASAVAVTNEYRREHGCSPVTVHSKLTLAAQAHADDMVAGDFFSHVSPDGGTLADRIDAVGYHYRLVGENIAAGFSSPEEVVDSWMESEKHRDNILNCEFVEIGIGYVHLEEDPGNESWHYYWVQVFGVEFE